MTRNTTSKATLLLVMGRLFRPLRLFWFLFPVSLVAIISASLAPSVFRWASGEWVTQNEGLRLLTFVAVVATFTRVLSWSSFELSAMWASQIHFKRMLRGLMRTRITYFDEHPSGSILSRFVKDFDELKSNAIIFTGDLLNASIEVLSVAGVALYAAPNRGAAAPWIFALTVPLVLWFIKIQTYRARMLAHLRGLGASAIGELLSRQTDLIEGRSIFVFFKKSKQLLHQFDRAIVDYARSQVLVFYTETWASFWLRSSGELFSFVILLALVLMRQRGLVDDTLSAVLISALFGITGSMGWLDFASGLVSKSAPHVKRVLEFQDLAPEQAYELSRDASSYASKKGQPGTIEFKDFAFRYRSDTPIVLQNLNLSIKLGTKVALIGRSGSGKTSILQALMRMGVVEQGALFWDGAWVFEQNASQFRKQFAVVPQTPYLFEGSLAGNLGPDADRFGHEVLLRVGLNYPPDFLVEEGGRNLSIGERQLVCLARAIYLQKQVILMDEPTSALDPILDAKIQKILQTEFQGKTLITIAHRLESLKYYDRIIEIGQGQILSDQTLTK